MAMGRHAAARQVKQVRRETLVALKMLYPAALMGEQLLRSLLILFPQLEWDYYRRDLVYLCEKGYIARVVADNETDEPLHRRPGAGTVSHHARQAQHKQATAQAHIQENAIS